MTRPVFRSKFVVRKSGRAFIAASETETRFLTGAAMERIVPLLDGSRLLEQILEQVTDIPEADAVDALRSLDDGGLLTEGPAGPASDAAFWELSGVDPKQVGERRSTARVEIVTVGRSRAEGIAQALEALGVRVESGSPFRIVVARDYRDPALEALNAEALERGITWMLVRPYGRTHWLGPILVPGRTACWRCMEHWLEVNGWMAQAVVANLPTLAAVTRTMAATEAAKWLLAGNGTLEGRIRALDMATLSFSDHPVIRLPQCAVCGGRQGASRAPCMRALISPITGVVSGLRQTHSEPGVSLTEGLLSRILWPDSSGQVFYSTRDAVAGRGATAAEAEVTCLGEAIERYSCRFHGDEPRIRAKLRDLGEEAVDPRRLLLYSGEQYRNRRTWNSGHSEFNRVGEPFDPGIDIEWTPATSLSTRERRFVPTGYCFMGYGVDFCAADSNGCAAGATVEDAMLNGLLELVERDAVALWWYNRAERPGIDLEALQPPRIALIVEAIRRRGREPHVLDLTTDFGIPVCVAVAARPDGSCVLLGSGAGLDIEAAARRAISELASVLLGYSGAASGSAGFEASRWLKEATLEGERWLRPASGRPGSIPQCRVAGLAECVERIEGRGLEVIALEVTRPETAIPAARVMVPGLRPWWARFAPGRLYETPVALGWREQSITEAGLNPIPFFF